MNTPDAATVTAFFTGLATLVAAVGALVMSWRAATHAASAKAEAAEAKIKSMAVEAKADTIILETAKIHTLTNDAKSKADAALAVANETIKGLQMLNTSLAASKQVPPPPISQRPL